MRRLLVIIVAGLATALGTAAAATGGNVVRFSGIDLTFQEAVLKEYVTEICGFPVYVQGEGALTVTLHRDREGRVVRETYSSPGAFVTYFAPTTGESYRFPWIPRDELVYPGGATLGGPATYRLTGMIVNHPGEPPEAGLIVLKGTVAGFSPDGIPLVEFTDDDLAAAVARGSLTRAQDPTPGICAALTGS